MLPSESSALSPTDKSAATTVNSKAANLPVVTRKELATHNNEKDLWIAIDDTVYDVTKWASNHPGGEHLLQTLAGQDASAVFHAFHTPHGTGAKALKLLGYLPQVARLESRPKTKLENAFIELRENIDKEGLYETSLSFYLALTVWLQFLLLATVYYTLLADDLKSTVFAGLIFGLFLQQTAFVGHDTAHNGITHDRKIDMFIGIVVGPLLTGVSTAWWKRSHNTHHVVTNSLTHDPDIQHMPLFAITENFWRKGGTFSYYHKHFFKFDGLARALISYQHILYYPVMALARWNLYAQGLILLLNTKLKVEWRLTELVALMCFATWVSCLVSVLPTWQLRLVWLLTSHMLAGVLHVQITLSHFSMPTYSGATFDATEGEEFLRQQLYTSMDVDTPWWFDWFHGGLQWQVVHHIFPRLPRHNLRRVQGMLQQMCTAHGVEYKVVSFLEGNVEIVKTLHAAAMKARASKVINFSDSELWKAMCAEG